MNVRRSVWVLSLLMAWGALYLPGLGHSIINRDQELRVALTSRTMAEGGSWLVPEFRGETRLRKPPLMYWIVATSYLAAGATDSLVAARLPSALAALGLALATYSFGARILGRRRAWLSALLVMSSFIVVRQGRLSETDVMLTLCTSISACCGYFALTRSRAVLWWLVAGIAGGIGFMTKGPAALALPPLAWLAFSLTHPRRWRQLLHPAVLPGFAAFALIVLPWYAAISFGFGVEAAAQEQMQSEVSRILTEKHHAGPIYYYVYTLFYAYAPWSLLLPFALVAAFRRMWHHAAARFVLAWFLTTFVTLSLVSTKSVHYATLLACPAALLMGWMLGFGSLRVQSWLRRFAASYSAVLLIALVGLGCVLATRLFVPVAWPVAACRIFGVLMAGTAATGLLVCRGCPLLRAFTAVLAIGSAVAFQALVADRHEQRCAVIPEFLQSVRSEVSDATEFYAVGSKDSVAEFYAGRKTLRAATAEEAWAAAAPGAAILVITGTRTNSPTKLGDTPPVREEQGNDYMLKLFAKPAR